MRFEYLYSAHVTSQNENTMKWKLLTVFLGGRDGGGGGGVIDFGFDAGGKYCCFGYLKRKMTHYYTKMQESCIAKACVYRMNE